jgi:HSP20 family molecular chaperone IbpA
MKGARDRFGFSIEPNIIDWELKREFMFSGKHPFKARSGKVKNHDHDLLRDECSGWAGCPPARVDDLGHAFEVRIPIAGLETESLVIEIGENAAVISGLRRLGGSDGTSEKVASFRRLIDLPSPVPDQECCASYHENTLFLLILK